MAKGYSDIPKTKKAKGKPKKGPDKRGRSMIRGMLAKELDEAGYTISRFMAGLVLRIDLGTIYPFGWAIEDQCWLKLMGMNLYGMGQRSWGDDIVKVASIADPDCASKVAQYVVNIHTKMLKDRMEKHGEYVEELKKTWDKYGKGL